MSLPFLLCDPVPKLARCYLRIAAKKPQSQFSTGDPLGAIDAMALMYLDNLDFIEFRHGLFQARPGGVIAHEAFEKAGR